MNAKTEWIKMNDRRPTETDLPVWVYDTAGSMIKGPFLVNAAGCVSWSHWRPAAADIPEPPREESQADKDEDALQEWLCDLSTVPSFADGWHAALAWERGEVEKMLPAKTAHGDLSEHIHVIESIRARCGGGGK